MTNAIGGRRARYKPKFKEMEAYDLLPPQVRKALQEGVNCWSSSGSLKHYKKYGWSSTVQWIQDGDDWFMSQRNWDHQIGPTKQLNLRPLRANW